MKKLLALLLTLALLFSLAACGGGDDDKTPSSDDKTPSSTQQQEQNTPDPVEGEDEPDNSGSEGAVSADDYELLKVLGLENAVPKNYTSFENSYDSVSSYTCDYYFAVPVDGDGNAERMEYANQVIEAICATSDDGKVYRNTGPSKWEEAALYTEGIDASSLPGLYFFKDGMVLALNLYDYGSDSEHNYNIVIERKADDYIKI